MCTSGWFQLQSGIKKNLDFQKCLQMCLTHKLNIEKDLMNCNIIEAITSNQADLDLSETSIEVCMQFSCKKWSLI